MLHLLKILRMLVLCILSVPPSQLKIRHYSQSKFSQQPVKLSVFTNDIWKQIVQMLG